VRKEIHVKSSRIALTRAAAEVTNTVNVNELSWRSFFEVGRNQRKFVVVAGD